MRQMAITAERIRAQRQHARVNKEYREALEHLAYVINIALEACDGPRIYGEEGKEIYELDSLYAMPAAKGH